MAKKMEDGSVVLVNTTSMTDKVSTTTDGTVSIEGVSLPQGAMIMAGGKVSVPKETKIVENSDGTISIGGKKMPPGTSTRVNSDGSVIVVPPEGGGAGKLSTAMNPDGSVSVGGITLPKGAGQNVDG